MAKSVYTEQEREFERLRKRMDRFDSVVTEYLRANRKTIEYLAEKIGCNPSSLWRYRKQIASFQKAPFDVICACLRMANVSNETIRYICGLAASGLSDRGTHHEN